MLVRFLLFVMLAFTVGCVARPPIPEEPEAAAPDGPANTPEQVDLAASVGAVPDACTLLLESLDDTRPLLSGLKESLAEQSSQLEQALSELREPPRRAPASECPANNASIGNKEIIGALEWVYMDPPGRHFRARVDSGAETSSLSASEVAVFERDGDDWVRFNFQDDSSDDPVHFELPIKRTVLIRQVSSTKPERRYVVDIDVRLDDQLQKTEFTLTDRSSMTYPVLLGRAFLMDIYVVDVSRSYTHDRYQAGR